MLDGARRATRGVVLICLSGIESSGKSTQLERLMESARRARRRPHHVRRRPGYTRNLEAAKRLARRLAGIRRRGVKGEAAERAPRSYSRRAEGFRSSFQRHLWLSLALIDLIWLHGFRIRLWRARGRTVVSDRYLWDCFVDFRVNIPDDGIETWRVAAVTNSAPEPGAELGASGLGQLAERKLLA